MTKHFRSELFDDSDLMLTATYMCRLYIRNTISDYISAVSWRGIHRIKLNNEIRLTTLRIKI
jgi:hypothetical protein